MSIISTAGLSLLIWIPVLTGMGMVTLALLGLVFPAMRAKPGEGSRSGASGTLSSGSSLSNVSRYVERIQGAGVPDEMILARLMRAGWSKDELTQAGVNDLLQVWDAQPPAMTAPTRFAALMRSSSLVANGSPVRIARSR